MKPKIYKIITEDIINKNNYLLVVFFQTYYNCINVFKNELLNNLTKENIKFKLSGNLIKTTNNFGILLVNDINKIRGCRIDKIIYVNPFNEETENNNYHMIFLRNSMNLNKNNIRFKYIFKIF